MPGTLFHHRERQAVKKTEKLISWKEKLVVMAIVGSLPKWPCLRMLHRHLRRPSYIPLPNDCPLCKPRYGFAPQYFAWRAPLRPPLWCEFSPERCAWLSLPPNLCEGEVLQHQMDWRRR